MGLLPEALLGQLPPLHSQDSLPDHELRAYARLTHAATGLIWFVMELDSKDRDTFSGYLLDAKTERFGYFSFDYLEEQLPPPLEYDANFQPQPLFEAVQQERKRLNQKGQGLKLSDTLAPHRAYYYAFAYTEPAKQKYEAVKRLIQSPLGPDLSAYHFPAGPLIVVIGDRPSEAVHARIMELLAGGTETTIAYPILMELFVRHLESSLAGGFYEQRSVMFVELKPKDPKRKRKQGK
jgi:hypothetical protein